MRGLENSSYQPMSKFYITVLSRQPHYSILSLCQRGGQERKEGRERKGCVWCVGVGWGVITQTRGKKDKATAIASAAFSPWRSQLWVSHTFEIKQLPKVERLFNPRKGFHGATH